MDVWIAHSTVRSTDTKLFTDSVFTTVVSTLYKVICVELYSFLASFDKNDFYWIKEYGQQTAKSWEISG